MEKIVVMLLLLKYKYGVNPLTVTWPPLLYTTYGYQNFKNWLEIGGFDNVSAKRNEELSKFLTKNSILNLFHPFQSFMLGQKIFPIRKALKLKIPLIFYGENEAEHGNSLVENSTSLRNNAFHTRKNLDNIFLGGIKLKDILKLNKFNYKDLNHYIPPSERK